MTEGVLEYFIDQRYSADCDYTDDVTTHFRMFMAERYIDMQDTGIGNVTVKTRLKRIFGGYTSINSIDNIQKRRFYSVYLRYNEYEMYDDLLWGDLW